MRGLDTLTGNKMALTRHARFEPAHAVTRANIIILVTTMNDDRVGAIGCHDLPIHRTVPVRKTNSTLLGTIDTLGSQHEGVIITAANDEGSSHLYHLVMVHCPIRLELL